MKADELRERGQQKVLKLINEGKPAEALALTLRHQTVKKTIDILRKLIDDNNIPLNIVFTWIVGVQKNQDTLTVILEVPFKSEEGDIRKVVDSSYKTVEDLLNCSAALLL